jgi:hypothetical protein
MYTHIITGERARVHRQRGGYMHLSLTEITNKGGCDFISKLKSVNLMGEGERVKNRGRKGEGDERNRERERERE